MPAHIHFNTQGINALGKMYAEQPERWVQVLYVPPLTQEGCIDWVRFEKEAQRQEGKKHSLKFWQDVLSKMGHYTKEQMNDLKTSLKKVNPRAKVWREGDIAPHIRGAHLYTLNGKEHVRGIGIVNLMAFPRFQRHHLLNVQREINTKVHQGKFSVLEAKTAFEDVM